MSQYIVNRAGVNAWYVSDLQAKAPASPNYPTREEANAARYRLNGSARLQRLYHLAVAADNAYQAELEHVYGPGSAEARYDYNRNTATPMLKLLYSACRAADDARHTASEELLTVTTNV